MNIETTIKIKLGNYSATEPGKTIELSESEARELQRKLNDLFGHEADAPDLRNIKHVPQYPTCPPYWSTGYPMPWHDSNKVWCKTISRTPTSPGADRA